jgi:hypothetical protein
MMMIGGNSFSQTKITVNEKDTVPLYSPFMPSVKFLSPLAQNFYSRHLGVMCRGELKVQQKIRMPLFFRLGSLEHVNRLEGKGQ